MAADPARFRRAYLATVVALVVLVAAFAVAGFFRGPGLSGAQLDTTAVVTSNGQLRLFLNQRVRPVAASAVSIVPAVRFTVTTAGQQLGVQFTEPLRYGTSYRVRVGVTSADDGQVSTVDYGFRTVSPPLYYLSRAPGGVDSIVRTGIREATREVAYSAARIQDFAVFGTSLVVATLDSSGHSALAVIGASGQRQEISLPGVGTLDELRADLGTGLVGFRFTSADGGGSPTLYTVSPAGTGVPQPVSGLAGAPLTVLDWAFVPASSDLLVQGVDQSVALVDLSKAGGVRPLGQFLQLGALSTDGRAATVWDAAGPLSLGLGTGTTTRIPPTSSAGRQAFGGVVVTSAGVVQQKAVYDSATGGFLSSLVVGEGAAQRKLFGTPDPRGLITAISVSPNSQYVAIETTPSVASAKSDGYPVNARPTSVTTYFVDIDTGAVVKSVAGFDVSW